MSLGLTLEIRVGNLEIPLNQVILLQGLAVIVDVGLLECLQLILLFTEGYPHAFLLSTQGQLLDIVIWVEVNMEEIFLQDDLEVETLSLYAGRVNFVSLRA